MPHTLEIRTLNQFSITCHGQPQTVRMSAKAQALLVYAACVGQMCRREFLAEFLWPGRTQTQSLTNLRTLLVELRQHVDAWLCITREEVGLHPDSGWWLDASEMGWLLTQARREAREGHLSPQAVTHLESALALYQRDFLDGLHLDSEDFEAWAGLERERLRYSIIGALDQLVEEYARRGDTRAGLDAVTRLLQIDSLREKTYRQAMRLLVESGQREAALRQYQTCQRILHDELGIAPSPQTAALYERIRAGEADDAAPGGPPPGQTQRLLTLPPQATTFIGRQNEIAALLDRLADQECRLLTIGGPGGIGKTRLALEVARRAAGRFAHGVTFVPLAPVSSAEAVAPAILSALSLHPPDNEPDLIAVLLHHLAEKSLLLVLDNMEYLLDDLSLVTAILTGAPQVRLLITSRQPLALAWEWYYALQGMPVPAGVGDIQAEAYSSVQLFVERARRVRHSFTLGDDPAGVIRICQIVEGMPLGIELAAAWVRVMSCAEIAASLVSLETPYQAVEVRHRSLRALFENVWDRLSGREQRLLMTLAVFRGGYNVAAVAAVSGAPPPDLALLVHKSLIGVDFRTDRYDMHQLLYQFLRAKLHEHTSLEEQALDAHSTYFVGFLHAREGDLRSGQPRRALDEIQTEIDNVRAAWSYALDRRRWDWVERACPALNTFYALKVLHFEAIRVFGHALEVLHSEPETSDRDRVELALQNCLIAPLTAIHGWESHTLWPVAERIRELAGRQGDNRQVLVSLILLVNLYINEEWERAVVLGREAVEFSRRLDQQAQMAAYVLNEIALIFTGRLAAALEHARAAQALFDPENCLWATVTYGTDPLVISLSHSGFTLTLLGYAEQGQRDLAQARARAESLAQPFALCFALAFTALSYLVTRETTESCAAGQRLAELAVEHGYKHWLVFGPCFHAIGLIQAGTYQEGIAALLLAIERERATGLTHNMPSWYAHLGYAYAQTGRPESGLAEIDRAFAEMDRTGERLHESLVCRFQGELHRLARDEGTAAACFERAILVAQRQQSKFYELQAALSLYDLMRERGEAGEGRARLATITAWFSEGLDRPDLVRARALLTETD